MVNGFMENISFDMQKDQGSDILTTLYDKYTEEGDGSFDPYEASVIIGTAVHYAWKSCAGVCEVDTVVYTFDNDPVNINITGGAIELGVANTEDSCDDHHNPLYCYPKPGKIFSFKDEVNEWTITKWGLHANYDSKLCNQRTGMPKGWAWGNFPCDEEDSMSKIKDDNWECVTFCSGHDPGEWHPVNWVVKNKRWFEMGFEIGGPIGGLISGLTGGAASGLIEDSEYEHILVL
jgi:hypothetical protein